MVATAIAFPTAASTTGRRIIDRFCQLNRWGSAINARCKVWADHKHAIAHSKYMVFDAKVVETGSVNYTQAAEAHNAENALVIRNPALAVQYLKNWQTHLEHSLPVKKQAEAIEYRP